MTRATADLREAAEDAWLWLLQDDSTAAASALQRLLRAVEISPSVAVAGCKVLDAEHPGTSSRWAPPSPPPRSR